MRTTLHRLREWWQRRRVGGWTTEWVGDHVHVVPIGDLIDHELTDDCTCGPEAELSTTDDGDRWVISHQSLDRREDHE